MDANLFIAEMSERLYAATATPYNGVSPPVTLFIESGKFEDIVHGEGGRRPGSCRPPRDLDIGTRTLRAGNLD